MWKRPKLMIGLFAIGAIVTIFHTINNPEQAFMARGESRELNPIYAIAGLLLVFMGYVMSSKQGGSDGDAFNSQYT